MLAIAFALVGTVAHAATITTIRSGNWSDTNVATSPWPGGTLPLVGDDIVIGNTFTLTVDGTYTVNSLNSGTTTTLQVNGGAILNVTTALRMPNTATTSPTASITGAGTINTAAFSVGGSIPPTVDPLTVTLNCSVRTLNVSGNATLTAMRNGTNDAVAVLNITTGTITVTGTFISVTGANAASTTTLNLDTGAPQDATLTVNGAGNAFGDSGNAGITTYSLDGTTSTVIYSGVNQTVFPTTYTNITLGGSGTKTLTATSTINGVLAIEGTTVTAGTTPTMGAASTINYRGSAAQVTGVELPATFSGSGGLLINNTNGVSLGAIKTITNISVGPSVGNSVFRDAGFQITSTGTLNLVSGTFNLGSAGTATTYPAFTTSNISAGTTVA